MLSIFSLYLLFYFPGPMLVTALVVEMLIKFKYLHITISIIIIFILRRTH